MSDLYPLEGSGKLTYEGGYDGFGTRAAMAAEIGSLKNALRAVDDLVRPFRDRKEVLFNVSPNDSAFIKVAEALRPTPETTDA